MIQRRERARGCMEYVLVLEETSEEGKIKEYKKLIGEDDEDDEEEGEEKEEEELEQEQTEEEED